MIGHIVEKIIIKYKYNKKDFANKLGINPLDIDLIIDNKKEIKKDLSDAIDEICNENIELFQIQENGKTNGRVFHNKSIDILLKKFKDSDYFGKEFNFYSNLTKKIIFSKIFNNKIDEYEKYIDERSYQYLVETKDKISKNFWLAIAEKIGDIKIKDITFGSFQKSSFETIVKGVLDLIINDNDFDKKMQKQIFEYLKKYGIFLINLSYMKSSGIKAANIKRGKNPWIIMSDNSKRKCSYIFNLLHQLFYILKYKKNEQKEIDKEKINNDVHIYLENYLSKYQKHNKEIEIFLSTFKNLKKKKINKEEYFNIIHNQTKLRVEFKKEYLKYLI